MGNNAIYLNPGYEIDPVCIIIFAKRLSASKREFSFASLLPLVNVHRKDQYREQIPIQHIRIILRHIWTRPTLL